MACSLLIRKINFIAVCTRPAEIRSFSPHMLRGAFGNTLAWLSRVYSDERSMENKEFESIYENVFKARNQGKYKPHIGGVNYNPYFFECERFDRRRFSPGDELAFSAVFMGDFANRHIPKIITAIKLMVAGDICGNFDCFVLGSAAEESNGGQYYNENGYLAPLPEAWDWSDRYNIPGTVAGISIVFRRNAPFVFTSKTEGAQPRLPFRSFVEKTLQRVEALCTDFSKGEQAIDDWEGLLERAGEAASEESADSRTRFLIEQTGRSKTGETTWAVSGRIDYSGSLKEFLPYINVCSVLHIGKGASMDGSGHYDWEIIA